MWTNDMTTKIRTTIPHIVFQLLDSVLEVIRRILNTRKSVSSGYPNTEKWVEKTKMRYSFRYNTVNQTHMGSSSIQLNDHTQHLHLFSKYEDKRKHYNKKKS